jgi:hypothetical protein
MKKLPNIAIFMTCLLATLMFATSNIGLALTTGHYCIVLWQVPFTDFVIARLPYWTWTATMLLWAVSILTILTLWIVVAVNTWTARKALN